MRPTLRLVALASVLTSVAASADKMATNKIVAGHGVVKAVAPTTGALTIAHDDIKGYMPAMEMTYRVRSPELAKDLHTGDVIDFTIDAAKNVIVGVRPAAHGQ